MYDILYCMIYHIWYCIILYCIIRYNIAIVILNFFFKLRFCSDPVWKPTVVLCHGKPLIPTKSYYCSQSICKMTTGNTNHKTNTYKCMGIPNISLLRIVIYMLNGQNPKCMWVGGWVGVVVGYRWCKANCACNCTLGWEPCVTWGRARAAGQWSCLEACMLACWCCCCCPQKRSPGAPCW